jgi:hypothetical protein
MKAQVSAEYLMLVGMAALLLVTVLAIISTQSKQLRDEREIEAIEDMGRYLQNEISIAYRVHDGYSRTIDLPIRKEGLDYEVLNLNNLSVTVKSGNRQKDFPVPSYIGNFTKGTNKIDRLGGIIYVNVI